MALDSSKLNHLVKDVRQKEKGRQKGNGPKKGKVINMVRCVEDDQKRKSIMVDEDWMNVPIMSPPVRVRDLPEEAIMVEAEIEVYLVRQIHVDEGASIEILYEQCFNMLHPAIRTRRSVSIRCQGYIGDFVLGCHAKDMVVLLVMSADSAVTYTSVHSEARSWSIPSEDPYEEVARQLLEQAPTPPLPPFFLSPRIRPPHTRAAMRQMRAAAPSTYHSLLPLGTLPLLPIPLPAPSTSRRADIPEADMPPRKRLLLTTPRPGCEVGESSAAAAARQPRPTMACRVDCSSIDTMETRKDHASVRAEIGVLRREGLAYEQESIQTRETLARSEAHCRTLEARITMLETKARRHTWQRQDADDHAVEHIMRT
ncbi:hypothetical protein Tco_1555640 [Tanacetum coccineum]